MRMKITALTTLLAALVSTSVGASVMEEIFTQSTLQADSPTVVTTPTQTGISLGQASFRVRPVYQNIAAFNPPQLDAGCGGIDFFAGSFSVISKDQIVQMGRAVAQGVPSYAFGLALNSVCPSCNTLVQNLQNKLEKLNSAAAEGCTGAVDFLNQEFDSELSAFTSSIESNSLNKMVGDLNDSAWFNDQGDKLSSSNDTGNIAKRAAKTGDVVEVNTAFKALKDAGLRSSSHVQIPSLDSDRLINLIMSLTGTVIIKANGSTDDDNSGMKIEQRKPLISARDLFNPPTRTGHYYMYSCSDQNTCLNMGQSTVQHKGLFHLFEESALRGLHQIRSHGTAALSGEERAVQHLAGISYQEAILQARGNSLNSLARLFAVLASRQIAEDIKAVITEVSNTVQNAPVKDAAFSEAQVTAYKKRLDKLKAEIKEQIDIYAAESEKDILPLTLLGEIQALPR